MKPPDEVITPDWKWGTAEGSRALDRLLDRRLSFREKLQWLEDAETLSLRFAASRQQQAAALTEKHIQVPSTAAAPAASAE